MDIVLITIYMGIMIIGIAVLVTFGEYINKCIKRFMKRPVDLWFSPNEIREETDNRIIIVENISIWEIFNDILIGVLVLLIFYFLKFSLILLFMIPIIIGIMRIILIKYSITIDKKSQSVIINGDGFLKSIKEIPFSSIRTISTKINCHDEGPDGWKVNLINDSGHSKEIYSTYQKADADMLVIKVKKIMDRC